MTQVIHIVTVLSADGRYGGPQTVATTIADALGHEVWGGASKEDFQTRGSRPRERRFRAVGGSRERFSTVAVPGLWWRLWRQAARSRRPDLVHVHGGSELCGLVAMALLVVRRCPFVAQPHGMYSYAAGSLRHRMSALLFMPLVRRATAIVALTNTERELLVDYGVPADRIEVIANGVSTPERPVDSAEPAQPAQPAEGNQGLMTTRPVVAFVGRMQERKHPERFTAAAALLARRGTHAAFVTAGADQGAMAVARAVDPDHVVTHLGGLPPAEARSLIASAAVVVVCSDVEPFGMVAIEALAHDTALLITDSCDLAAELADAGAALVTAPRPDAIADGIAALLDDDTRRNDQIAAGAKLVRDRYSTDVVMPQWARLYSGLVG